MNHSNNIVSKEKILNHVWDYDSDVVENSVEVYITHLRNKIDKPFKQSMLRTNRGFGYILEG